MDIEERRGGNTVSWVIAITMLVAVAGAQIYQIALTTTVAGEIELPGRKYMHRLAWLALVVLSAELVVLFWLAVRFLVARSRLGEMHHSETPYVDAWAAAGERFKLNEVDEDEAPDDPDELDE